MNRYRHRDRLTFVDLIEVEVHDVALDWVPLQLADQDLYRAPIDVQVDNRAPR